MNNKGKSRKRAAAKPQPLKPTNDENKPILDNTDIKNQFSNTGTPELSTRKGIKRVRKQTKEENDSLKSQNENCEEAPENKVASEVHQPSNKQVKRARANKKNSKQEVEKVKPLEDSSKSSSSTPIEQNDSNGETEQKNKSEAVSKPNKNTNKGRKNKAQKSENEMPVATAEVIKEAKVASMSVFEESTEIVSGETTKTTKRGRTNKNEKFKKSTLNEGTEAVAECSKKPTKTKKNKTYQRPEHKTADTPNEAVEIQEENPDLTKPAKKQAKQKTNKFNVDGEKNLKVNVNTKKKPEQTENLREDDVSPDEDFEIERPLVNKSNKPKPRKPSTSASSSKEEKAAKPPNRSILQLKITLRDITPPIYRRIQVLNNNTFCDLHDHINEAMGWMSDRSHQFIVFNPKTNSNMLIVNGALEGLTYDFNQRHLFKEQTTKLSRFLLAKGDSLLYEFDLGDSWIHEVFVEKILPPPPPKAEYPKCTGGKRACPPEDCGGVDGYNHLVEIYKNPDHEEYKELITDWLGEYNPGWDPEKFNKRQIFRRVRMWVWAPA